MNYPLSNTDLYQLVAALGIKNFRGMFLVMLFQIVNIKMNVVLLILMIFKDLERIGTAYRITKKENEYFDSFGLPMPEEVKLKVLE